MMKIELCIECDQPTLNAGYGDGSIYIEFDDEIKGPYCTECNLEFIHNEDDHE